MNTNKVILCGLIFFGLLASSCDLSSNEKAPPVDSKQVDTEEIAEAPIALTLRDKSPQAPPLAPSPVSPVLVDPVSPVVGPNFWPGPGLPVPFSGGIASVQGYNSDDDGDDDGGENEAGECECQGACNLGSAGFSGSGPDSWFVINTMSFPTTVLVSQNRNSGFVRGGVGLTATGLQINEPGTYWATYSAILLNNDPNNTPFIPTFLVSNGALDQSNPPTQLGAVGSLLPNQISTLQGNGILSGLAAGTTLSILATNAGSPDPIPVTVVGWNIAVYKICD